MSKYAEIVKKQPLVEESVSEVNLTVRDTDFLLKLIMRSQFEGNEVEQAYNVISKLVSKHRRNLES
ncbi:MAG: hypothetical protein CMH20_03370 [Methylophaga sp.]|jgi:hypothetical protein|nr:hypothetical protein [Methylophaga sp.]|tara:strand:- start:1034 stop:1231 length:198 start_codon:yes stop_codon:yes gene_type:complete